MTSDTRGRHPGEETLHRHAEGDLPAARAAAVERHLRSCTRCREEVEELDALLERAARLPRGVAPPRDLWGGIEGRIRGGAARRAEGSPGVQELPWREAAPWLAAAAAVLVAVTAGATLWLAGGDGGTPVAPGPAPREAGLETAGMLAGLESGYRSSVDRLAALLEQRGERLPPEAREALERNLRIIDRAIAESERALAENPASPEAVRALDRSYQRKIDLLRRSAKLTAQL